MKQGLDACMPTRWISTRLLPPSQVSFGSHCSNCIQFQAGEGCCSCRVCCTLLSLPCKVTTKLLKGQEELCPTPPNLPRRNNFAHQRSRQRVALGPEANWPLNQAGKILESFLLIFANKMEGKTLTFSNQTSVCFAVSGDESVKRAHLPWMLPGEAISVWAIFLWKKGQVPREVSQAADHQGWCQDPLYTPVLLFLVLRQILSLRQPIPLLISFYEMSIIPFTLMNVAPLFNLCSSAKINFRTKARSCTQTHTKPHRKSSCSIQQKASW